MTLLFARSAYEEVAEAYIAGLEARARRRAATLARRERRQLLRQPHRHAVDAQLEAKLKTATSADKATLDGLRGKVAIANAKLAYQSYKAIFAGPRWEALASAGRAGRSACCGRAPARRTRTTATSSTSRS